jgi:hypothetical protein
LGHNFSVEFFSFPKFQIKKLACNFLLPFSKNCGRKLRAQQFIELDPRIFYQSVQEPCAFERDVAGADEQRFSGRLLQAGVDFMKPFRPKFTDKTYLSV